MPAHSEHIFLPNFSIKMNYLNYYLKLFQKNFFRCTIHTYFYKKITPKEKNIYTHT